MVEFCAFVENLANGETKFLLDKFAELSHFFLLCASLGIASDYIAKF